MVWRQNGPQGKPQGALYSSTEEQKNYYDNFEHLAEMRQQIYSRLQWWPNNLFLPPRLRHLETQQPNGRHTPPPSSNHTSSSGHVTPNSYQNHYNGSYHQPSSGSGRESQQNGRHDADPSSSSNHVTQSGNRNRHRQLPHSHNSSSSSRNSSHTSEKSGNTSTGWTSAEDTPSASNGSTTSRL
ncbi:putative uncharacterized protein DDB_G0279653 [Aplysia californica]|uniref:Uncharacterized protein n=1 Tax=Aplysia californica TaxID=6500 RepID=A0ABM0JU03_APLCA|nr:putative uncharacterized protein DDB_G0279653 [Aplysia californica]